jgi:hypothetical protein
VPGQARLGFVLYFCGDGDTEKYVKWIIDSSFPSLVTQNLIGQYEYYMTFANFTVVTIRIVRFWVMIEWSP